MGLEWFALFQKLILQLSQYFKYEEAYYIIGKIKTNQFISRVFNLKTEIKPLKKKIAILISGKGTNMEAIIKDSKTLIIRVLLNLFYPIIQMPWV